MGGRKALVIASQCRVMGELSFLPGVAEDLYQALTDLGIGECEPALEGSGFVIDPTVEEARQKIDEAFQSAAEDESVLVLAYVGHGEHRQDPPRFYLMPYDAPANPRDHTAIEFSRFIVELLEEYEVGGLIALIDACGSGLGGQTSLSSWTINMRSERRFQILTSSATDAPSYNGCFTQRMVDWISAGIGDTRDEYIRCERMKAKVGEDCSDWQTTAWSGDDRSRPSRLNDPGLYLARNVAASVREDPLAGTPTLSKVLDLVDNFKETPLLGAVAEKAKVAQCLALVGSAGSGKSALAAALREGLGDAPSHFVQAISLITVSSTPESIALELSAQLAKTVPGFGRAVEAVRVEAEARGELEAMGAFRRYITEPLKRVDRNEDVRLVVDGLDQLSHISSVPVLLALNDIATNALLDHVRLLITARQETALPPEAETMAVRRADQDDVEAYLRRRLGVVLTADQVREIAEKVDGSWLVARLMADVIADEAAVSGIDPESVPENLEGLYDRLIRGAVSEWAGLESLEEEELREERVVPLLSIMAAAGAGTVMPVQLLAKASEMLGGPGSIPRVRDVLVWLNRIVDRSRPGTEEEQVGLFHATAAEYVLGLAPDRTLGSHKAVAEAIRQLAPAEKHDALNLLHKYAFDMETEHLWQAGEHDRAILSLEHRSSPSPAENAQKWKEWSKRVTREFALNNPRVLTCRHYEAQWTGMTGDYGKALNMHQALAADMQNGLPSHDRRVLMAPLFIAYWLGRQGNRVEAISRLRELEQAQSNSVGANERDDIRIKFQIAYWLGQSLEPSDVTEALHLANAILPRHEEVHGANHPETLRLYNLIAFWKGRLGDTNDAIRIHEDILRIREREQGRNDYEILLTRGNIALWKAKEDLASGLEMFEQLLDDQERLVGKNQLEVVRTRRIIKFLRANGWNDQIFKVILD